MQKILLVGIFLQMVFLQGQKVQAQEDDPPIPAAPTGGNVVLDTLDWLTPEQEDVINEINQKLDAEGIAQIEVVTLDDCGNDPKKFRNDLFRSWGIGHKDDNDGLLILVCWYGGDANRRSVEQETGYGLEGTLPDILTARVAKEEYVPQFQSGRPGAGLVAMVKRYDALLRKVIPVETESPNSNTISPLMEVFFPESNAFDVVLIVGISILLGTLPGGFFGIVFWVWLPEKIKTYLLYLPGSVFIISELLALLLLWRITSAVDFQTWLSIPWLQQHYTSIAAILAVWALILVIILAIMSKGTSDSSGRDYDRWDRSDQNSGNNSGSYDGGSSGGGGSSTKF